MIFIILLLLLFGPLMKVFRVLNNDYFCKSLHLVRGRSWFANFAPVMVYHGILSDRSLIQESRLLKPVLQRRPLMIEPGGLEGGVESGLLKNLMGIEGAFFNVLLSKNSSNSDENFYL